MDRHLNLFFTYNTAHLEDNVTRALMLTLSRLSPVHLRLFIQEVILSKSHNKNRKRLDLLAAPNFTFDLQVTPPDRSEGERLNSRTGLIVGINYTAGQNLSFDTARLREGCRPDAVLIDGENELTLIFESKLTDSHYKQQIQRHCAGFFDSETRLKDVFVEIRWTDIAQFFTTLGNRTNDAVEKMVLEEFVQYIDLLNLVDFLGFNKLDFASGNVHKLNAFLVHLRNEVRKICLPLKENSNLQQLWFEDVPYENVWVDYSDQSDGGLSCGVVAGSGKKRRAEQFRDFVEQQPERFRTVVERLRRDVAPDLQVCLRIKSVFSFTRFQTARLRDIRGRNPFPSEYLRFCATLKDREVNTYRRLTKKEINATFHEEIEAQEPELDSDGLFPKWKDANSVLQYCYVHIDVEIPRAELVGKSGTAVVEYVARVVGQCHSAMTRLNDEIEAATAASA